MRRFPQLLALALLAGCASATPLAPPATTMQEPAMTDTDSHSIHLGIGERARLPDGSTLTYLQLVNDSRCPPDVQCIWAGDAEIALRWQPAGGAARELRLHTNPQQGRQTEAAAGRQTIRLQALARGIAPEATLQITPATP